MHGQIDLFKLLALIGSFSLPLSHGIGIQGYRLFRFQDSADGYYPAFLCILARPKAPFVECPPRPLWPFVLAVSSNPWLSMVIFGLDGFLLHLPSPNLFLYSPAQVFPCTLLTPTVIGPFHSTSIVLNNAHHTFWNLSKTGQSVSDVFGLPKKPSYLWECHCTACLST